MINISQRRRVLGYYKRGDLEITSITVQQFRHRWAGADPGYFVTGLNCGEAAMVIGGSGGEAPGKIF